MKIFPLGLWLVAAMNLGAAETHRHKPSEYHGTFSFAHAPALRIRPGDTVITETVDSGGLDRNGVRPHHVPKVSNPLTGPFYVEGAEAGDVLVVTLVRIEPNRDTARSSTLLTPYAVDPRFLRSTGERTDRREGWIIDKEKGVARTTTPGLQPHGLEVPLRPMLGCVGVAPRAKEAIAATTPGDFGGNMDYQGMVVGVKLMLPVSERGALLYVGDGHARQGDGELVGTGLETSMDVEFKVDLIKNKKIGWPRLDNGDYIMVLGSARVLLEALQHATTEMLQLLMKEHGYDERTASMLMGQVGEFEIANVVDPKFTVVAKMRKSYLK